MEPEQATPRAVPAHELRIVGGNAALDLCNSRSGPHDGGTDIDSLTEAVHIVPWAVHAGVISAGEADELGRGGASSSDADATDLDALVRLREQAHAVFAALAAGADPDPEAMDELRRAETDAAGRARQVRVEDHYEYSWPASSRAVVRDRVAHAAAELLRDGPLSRVKQCAGCSFLFLDESKNGSRRWCSMEDCGREAKMRLYVERRRARSAA
ncbi:CGNR zinc finger domain-containing protein [Microbacterium mangrovi]|uniref:CGNR zinc finger domain-containing protein n=1 Tax=Microbacterium mangrovi TaxID=1348253 RepID=UPI000689EC29|nr:ABATE domain-containing protein [Microbacterium mangrovi]